MWDNFFLKQFVKFSTLLLLKMNVLDIFNIIDLLTIFVISRGTKILIELNWLGVYVSRILNVHNRQINILIWNEKLTFFAAAALFFKLTLRWVSLRLIGEYERRLTAGIRLVNASFSNSSLSSDRTKDKDMNVTRGTNFFFILLRNFVSIAQNFMQNFLIFFKIFYWSWNIDEKVKNFLQYFLIFS